MQVSDTPYVLLSVEGAKPQLTVWTITVMWFVLAECRSLQDRQTADTPRDINRWALVTAPAAQEITLYQEDDDRK